MIRHEQHPLHAHIVDEEVGDDSVGHVERVERGAVPAGRHARATHVVCARQELAARHARLRAGTVHLKETTKKKQ